MLSSLGSPLVAGSTAPLMDTQFIRIERSVYVNRVVQPAGAVIEVPKHLALELIHTRKASAAEKPAPVVEAQAPATVETDRPKKRVKE